MTEETEFDLRNAALHFRLCSENEEMDIREYLKAWKEINKMFAVLGRLFSFVQSDVIDKIRILDEYLNGAEGIHFKTLGSMIAYEMQLKRTHSLKPPSGSRTILRLHRALQFVVRFIKDVHDSAEEEKMAPVANRAYDETLGHYHSWLVRKGVHIAVYTLPRRNQLIADLSGHLVGLDADKAMTDAVNYGQVVYDKAQTMLKSQNLLDLP